MDSSCSLGTKSQRENKLSHSRPTPVQYLRCKGSVFLCLRLIENEGNLQHCVGEDVFPTTSGLNN